MVVRLHGYLLILSFLLSVCCVRWISAATLKCQPFHVVTKLTPTSDSVENEFHYEGTSDVELFVSSVTKFCAGLGIGTDCTEYVLENVNCTTIALECQPFQLVTQETPDSASIVHEFVYGGDVDGEPFVSAVAEFCSLLNLGIECTDYILDNINCTGAVYQPVEVRHEFEMVAAVVFRNAARYLAEWVEFHALMGMDRLVMYNHGSNDDFMDVLAPYVGSGLVDLRHAVDIYPKQCRIKGPDEPSPKYGEFNRLCQMPLLKHFYMDYFSRTKWYVLLDIDELIFPGPGALLRYGPNVTLPELLDTHYSDKDAVSLYFTVFGAPEEERSDTSLMLESHRSHGPHVDPAPFMCYKQSNVGLKQVVKMSALLNHLGSVHERLCQHCRTIDVPKESVWLRGNHYQYRSKAELAKKVLYLGNNRLSYDVARNAYLTSVPGDNGAGFWLPQVKRNIKRSRAWFDVCPLEDPWMSTSPVVESAAPHEAAGRYISESSTELILQDKNLSDIGGDLERFKSLRKLDVSFNFFTQLDRLGQFPKLTHLSAYTCCIESIDRIDEVPRLSVLRLQQNKISYMPFALEQLKKLTELRMDRNCLTTIEHLQYCSSLQTLNLGNNRIKSVDGLVGLQSLVELRLSNNQITSLRSLKGLPAVQELDISYNQLTSLDGIQFLPTLQMLHAEHNKLTTVQIGQTYSRSNQKLKNLGKGDSAKIEKNAKLLAAKTNALNSSRSSKTVNGSASGKQRINTATSSNSVVSGSDVLSSGSTAGPSAAKDDIVLGHPALTDVYLKHNCITSLAGMVTLGPHIEIFDVTYNKLTDIDGVVSNIKGLTELTELYIANNPMQYSEQINDNGGDGNVFSRRDCGESAFDSGINTDTALMISTTTLANSPHPTASPLVSPPGGTSAPDDSSITESARGAPLTSNGGRAGFSIDGTEMARVQAQNYWKRVLTPLLNATPSADDSSAAGSMAHSIRSGGLISTSGVPGTVGLGKLRSIDNYKIVVKEKEVMDQVPLFTPPPTAANLSTEAAVGGNNTNSYGNALANARGIKAGMPPLSGGAKTKSELLELLGKHDKGKETQPDPKLPPKVVVSVEFAHMNPLSLFKTWENSPGPSPVKAINPSSLLDSATTTHIEKEVELENKPKAKKERRVYTYRADTDNSDDDAKKPKRPKDEDEDEDEDFEDYQGGPRAPTLFLKDMKSEKEMQAIEHCIKELVRKSKSKISEQVSNVMALEQQIVREQEEFLKGISKTLHPAPPKLKPVPKSKPQRRSEDDEEFEAANRPPRPVFTSSTPVDGTAKPGVRSTEPPVVTSGHVALPRPPVRSVFSTTQPMVPPAPTAPAAAPSVDSSVELNMDTLLNTVRNTTAGSQTRPLSASVDEELLRPLSRGNTRDNPRPKSGTRVKFSDPDAEPILVSPSEMVASSAAAASSESTEKPVTEATSRPTSASSNMMQKFKGNIGMDARKKTKTTPVVHNFAAKPNRQQQQQQAQAPQQQYHQERISGANVGMGGPLLQVTSIQPNRAAPAEKATVLAPVAAGEVKTDSLVGTPAELGNIPTERMYTAEGGLAKRTQSGSALLDAAAEEGAGATADLSAGTSGFYSPRLGTGRLGTGRLGTGLNGRRGSASNVLDDATSSRQTTASNLGVPGTRGSEIDYNRLMSASREGSLASRDGESYGFAPGSSKDSRGGSRQLHHFRVPSKAKESIQGKDYENILHHQLKQGLGKSSLGADSESDSASDEDGDRGAARKEAKRAKAQAKSQKAAHVPSDLDGKTEEELLAVLEEYEDKILVSLGRDLEREDQARSRLTSASGSRGGDAAGAVDVDVDVQMTGDCDGQQEEEDEEEDVLDSLEIDAIVSYKEDEDDDDDDDDDEEEDNE